MKFAKKLFLTFIFNLFALSSFALQISATVIHIHDGDTITVTSPELTGQKSVRMIGIDTPEVDFNGFTQGQAALEARDYLRSLLPIGSQVSIDLGRDGSLTTRRLLGRVIFENNDLNKLMLLSGLAAPYFIDPFEKKIMMDYVAIAKEIFLHENEIFSKGTQIPYEFRMTSQNRTGTNYIGDIETKILYYPEEAYLVPVYKRLFISSVQRAKAIGYKLRE